jgi:hypothetical protein
MLNNPNPLLSKVEWCIHFTSLFLDHLKVVEAMGLNVVTSGSPALPSPAYKMVSKSVDRFKSYYGGHTHSRHTDW